MTLEGIAEHWLVGTFSARALKPGSSFGGFFHHHGTRPQRIDNNLDAAQRRPVSPHRPDQSVQCCSGLKIPGGTREVVQVLDFRPGITLGECVRT